MKILLIAIIVCMLNILCVSSTTGNINVQYKTGFDTIPPGMQPVSPSTVNGNNTPVLPPDTGRKNMVDTTHMIH
jgi:hypothetical protein